MFDGYSLIEAVNGTACVGKRLLQEIEERDLIERVCSPAFLRIHSDIMETSAEDGGDEGVVTSRTTGGGSGGAGGAAGGARRQISPSLEHQVMGRVGEEGGDGAEESKTSNGQFSIQIAQQKGGATRRPSRRAPLSPSMKFELELKATVVQKRMKKKRSAKKKEAATLLQSRFRGYSFRKKNANRNGGGNLGGLTGISPSSVALPGSSGAAAGANSRNKWYRHDVAVRKMLEHRARPPAYFEQRAAMTQNQWVLSCL